MIRVGLAADGRRATPLPQSWLECSRLSDGDGFIGFWEASVREELQVTPGLLD